MSDHDRRELERLYDQGDWDAGGQLQRQNCRAGKHLWSRWGRWVRGVNAEHAGEILLSPWTDWDEVAERRCFYCDAWERLGRTGDEERIWSPSLGWRSPVPGDGLLRIESTPRSETMPSMDLGCHYCHAEFDEPCWTGRGGTARRPHRGRSIDLDHYREIVARYEGEPDVEDGSEVDCGRCGAARNEPCRNRSGNICREPHADRSITAERHRALLALARFEATETGLALIDTGRLMGSGLDRLGARRDRARRGLGPGSDVMAGSGLNRVYVGTECWLTTGDLTQDLTWHRGRIEHVGERWVRVRTRCGIHWAKQAEQLHLGPTVDNPLVHVCERCRRSNR